MDYMENDVIKLVEASYRNPVRTWLKKLSPKRPKSKIVIAAHMSTYALGLQEWLQERPKSPFLRLEKWLGEAFATVVVLRSSQNSPVPQRHRATQGQKIKQRF
jgi:hypothetical protein